MIITHKQTSLIQLFSHNLLNSRLIKTSASSSSTLDSEYSEIEFLCLDDHQLAIHNSLNYHWIINFQLSFHRVLCFCRRLCCCCFCALLAFGIRLTGYLLLVAIKTWMFINLMKKLIIIIKKLLWFFFHASGKCHLCAGWSMVALRNIQSLALSHHIVSVTVWASI